MVFVPDTSVIAIHIYVCSCPAVSTARCWPIRAVVSRDGSKHLFPVKARKRAVDQQLFPCTMLSAVLGWLQGWLVPGPFVVGAADSKARHNAGGEAAQSFRSYPGTSKSGFLRVCSAALVVHSSAVRGPALPLLFC